MYHFSSSFSFLSFAHPRPVSSTLLPPQVKCYCGNHSNPMTTSQGNLGASLSSTSTIPPEEIISERFDEFLNALKSLGLERILTGESRTEGVAARCTLRSARRNAKPPTFRWFQAVVQALMNLDHFGPQNKRKRGKPR
jgi:hypothetical protein